jgi:hypothetical protein
MGIFEIQNIENISKLYSFSLWTNQLLCGPYQKNTYYLHRDYDHMIKIIQAIDEFILLQDNYKFKTQVHSIYKYLYDLPIGWFKLTIYSHHFYSQQIIYCLYEKNKLIIYSKIPKLLDDIDIF